MLDTIWAWYIGINLTTIAVYGLDKVISNINEPMLEERTYLRAPEWVLYLLLPLLGGGIGAGLGIRFF
ncbi:MAG: DUF1294 domain-containing protein [Anaerolineae bacterium]|nr:DUF1294 domain-containing protein [Anaerolineae bacterium]